VAQNPRGSLRGAVQDATGARIAFAKIVVESADASLRRESQSEDRGEFRINDLPAGDYRVAVNAKGFREAQADVSVEVSSVREVAVTLEPVAAPETVNVRSQTSSVTTQPIDPVSVVHQGVISSQDLKSLPLAQR
jgi:hypothetical protein